MSTTTHVDRSEAHFLRVSTKTHPNGKEDHNQGNTSAHVRANAIGAPGHARTRSTTTRTGGIRPNTVGAASVRARPPQPCRLPPSAGRKFKRVPSQAALKRLADGASFAGLLFCSSSAGRLRRALWKGLISLRPNCHPPVLVALSVILQMCQITSSQIAYTEPRPRILFTPCWPSAETHFSQPLMKFQSEP